MAARLAYYHAASGKLLSCLPLQLTLRGKSTTQSYRTPIYYVDLTLRDGTCLQDAITTAKEIDVQSKQAGFYQEELDQVARQGYANAKFEMECESEKEVVDEFYPSDEQQHAQAEVLSSKVTTLQNDLVRSVKAIH